MQGPWYFGTEARSNICEVNFDHGKRHKRRQDLRSRYNQAVGTSIEIRSESANRRTEKGHLEMDTVRGGRGSKAAVLTIVDRVRGKSKPVSDSAL
ncbi:hypothetical protein [Lacticaseibacillus paracasei]|uniref:hypothetical protein n=1 Tax=Lacticaseibacillus paracasei TaxID=1597 RepID=UPI0038579524